MSETNGDEWPRYVRLGGTRPVHQPEVTKGTQEIL